MPNILAIAVIAIVVVLMVAAFRSTPDEPAAIADTQGLESPTSTTPSPTATPQTADPPTQTPTGQDSAVDALPNDGPHRPLSQVDGWLQSDVTSLEQLRGKVVVVQFWTFGCINCKNTLPNLIDLYGRYGRDQVEIVGIHAPEFSFEEVPANVVAAADELGVTWPIVLDTKRRTFHDWQEGSRAFWPRTYVLDQQGDIRFDHIGEGGYDQLNATVAALVAIPA